jgi:hypothetical protein
VTFRGSESDDEFSVLISKRRSQDSIREDCGEKRKEERKRARAEEEGMSPSFLAFARNANRVQSRNPDIHSSL